MKHEFGILDRTNVPSMCWKCMSLIPVDKRDDECIVPVVIGEAMEDIEIGSAVVAFITPTGTAKIRKANADEELP